MELCAVIKTLQYFKIPTKITIYCDSQYVVNTINSELCFKWFRENDYEKKNLDLWFELVDLLSFHIVTMIWVKGHENNKYNEMADMYAGHAARCLNIQSDDVKNKGKEDRKPLVPKSATR